MIYIFNVRPKFYPKRQSFQSREGVSEKHVGARVERYRAMHDACQPCEHARERGQRDAAEARREREGEGRGQAPGRGLTGWLTVGAWPTDAGSPASRSSSSVPNPTTGPGCRVHATIPVFFFVFGTGKYKNSTPSHPILISPE